MTVLLLNITYEPIGVIAVRRAVNLLLADKAEVVEVAKDRVVRSPSRSQPYPSVLRWRPPVNAPQRAAAWPRRGGLTRPQYTCQYCGKRMAAREATIDHILPQWQ